MGWPNDADGDVMRQLHAEGFDFDREIEIDFNIDFKDWPSSQVFMNELAKAYPDCEISLEDDYVLLKIAAQLTYPFVREMQAKLTQIAQPHGGRCESWGVLWEPKTAHEMNSAPSSRT